MTAIIAAVITRNKTPTKMMKRKTMSPRKLSSSCKTTKSGFVLSVEDPTKWRTVISEMRFQRRSG